MPRDRQSKLQSATVPAIGRLHSFISELPLEILDIIFGDCGLDNHELKACSLVCRTWAARSRYYLFSHLNVRCSNASKFIDLVDSPQSTLSLKSCARSLHASVAPQSKDEENLAVFFKAVNIILDAGIKTLMVQRLFMRHIAVPRVEPNLITALHLRHSSFDDVGSLTKFLSDFDSLESLTLENTYLQRRHSEDLPQDQGWSRHLQSLSIYGTMGSFTNPAVSMSPILDCVRGNLRCLTLKGCVHPVELKGFSELQSVAVDARFFSRGRNQSVLDLLHTADTPQAVHELLLTVCYDPDELDRWHELDAALCQKPFSALQKLDINVLRDGSVGSPDRLVKNVRTFFPQCEAKGFLTVGVQG